MKYDEAMDYIHSTCKFGSRLGLENIKKLLELMGQPQNSFNSVHVAGTNGKGSTCAFIDSILREAGYKTGLYTSPFLERFTERIRVQGKEIPSGDLGRITGYVRKNVGIMLEKGYSHPTEFEIVTAIGFEYFKRERIEYAVVEVGLGARLDATNTVVPEICVITSISMDHMGVLGNDLVSISREKAGIIKKGIPVVLHPQKEEVCEVIKETCARLDAPLIDMSRGEIVNWKVSSEGQSFDFIWQDRLYKEIFIRMLGRHQVGNAATAVVTALNMGMPEEAIRAGLEKTRWPGRMEILREKPLVMIDGAHNVEGAAALVEGLKQVFPSRKVLLVFGILMDKEVEKVTEILASYANRIITTPPASPRGMDPHDLGKIVKKYNPNVEITMSIGEAVDKSMVMVEDDGIIVFSGSLYMIGEVRKLLPPEIL